MPVVHCTYLVRRDALDQLTYVDETSRFEYVVFSDSARKAQIPQYFDNRQIYGYIAFDEGEIGHVDGGFDLARRLMLEEEDLNSGRLGQVFSRVYRDGQWGNSGDPAMPFYSGPGSR